MRRIYGYALIAVLLTLLAVDRSPAAPGPQIIAETTAARHGLARPWFTQAKVDPTRGRLTDVLLDKGTLFVLSDQATLQAIDAENGQTLWTSEVGRREHPSMRPAVCDDMVAVINGSSLYILNRHSGKLLWQRQIEGAPGAGPALSDIRAYVPTTDGLVLAYRLEPVTDPALELGLLDPNNSEEDARLLEQRRRDGMRLHQELEPPLACRSFGRALVQPLITHNEGEEYVAWPTDRGYLFVGRIDRREEDFFEMRYKLETNADISARPTLLPPLTGDPADSGIIFAPSRDGFLHAIREKDGSPLWQFSTGEPMVEPAAPIRQRVYITTQLGGMYCLASQTGQQLWWAPGIRRFVAASATRVYAEDRFGDLVALHAETGGQLDTLPTPGLSIKMMNLQTDRIYLASESGLVHCLREVELAKPIQHRPETVPTTPKPKQPQEKPAQKPTAPANPFDQGGAAAADPFAAGGNNDPFAPAAGAPGAANDPFGAGGADPFGAGGSNPFDAGGAAGGMPGGGNDPFGAGGGNNDPFGAGGGGNNGNDPFGAGAPDPFGGTDPFGG